LLSTHPEEVRDVAIERLDVATVQVGDQDRAKEFFVEKLGFELVRDEEFGGGFRWLAVRPSGAQTSIVLAQGYGEGQSQVGAFTGLVFHATDIHATFRELSGRDVKFTEEPSLQPWGMMQAQFEDDDGNGYVLVGPPDE
jgi:catechol 2,3-dioxygenase-like lactoylglutathione lyase family enzyme